MLVDDSLTFLRATTQFLEVHDDVVIVGTANEGKEALVQVERLQPQVILIDLAMPGLPGLETIPRLRSMMPDVGIIALTVMNTNSFRQAALAAGADIFIPKATMRTDLLPAIRRLVRTDRKKIAESVAPSLGEDGELVPRSILVMEDNAHLRRLFGKALRASGYQVHTAGTLQEAREALARVRFDVLLCDIHMGEDRGTDLLREHAEAFATFGTQVVMVSGEAHYRDMCEEMGADFFLEKPVAVGTLVALVDRLTARQGFAS
jgi:CheY-like chemotaxis protein